MKVYETLYDWQKLFVDNNPKEYFKNKFGEERVSQALGESFQEDNDSEKIGFFLRMGIGKTKISVAKAEKMNADAVIAVSLKTKVTAGEVEGEFGDELKLAGYKVFYAHRAFDENGDLTIMSLDSKKMMKEFTESVEAGEKVAYIINHEHITTKKGYQRLLYLASSYKNIAWIIDEAHKISNRRSNISKKIHNMLYRRTTPDININLRDLNRDIKSAQESNDIERLKELHRLDRLKRTNVFKDNIKGFYLLTGTPNSSGYESFYWLLELLGYRWEYDSKEYDEKTDSVVVKHLKGFDAFFSEYCIEDTFVKKFSPYAKVAKGYKNVDKLLDIVQIHSFFAKTHNYYEGMPTRLVDKIVVPKDKHYVMMTDPAKENPHYRVLGGYIADTPALLGLRARQLASGFMGNAEHSDYYHTVKVDALEEVLTEKEDNYIIFYNYTPELYLIMSAAESAGYNIDIWNGHEKSQHNYIKAKGKKGEKNVLIANIASGSAALNLQKYSNVIFFALPDKFMDYDQAIGRVERIGQKAKEVSVIVMYMKGTIEEKVWKRLQIGKDYTDKMYERDIIWREL
jgi:hypothetical protein